jgi:hypothetical protein
VLIRLAVQTWCSTHKAEFYSGLMDDVAIFDTALPDAAVPQAMLGDFKSKGGALCVRASQIPVAAPKTLPGEVFDMDVDLTVGAVIEATLSCPSQVNNLTGSGKTANLTAGLLVRGKAQATFLWNCASQTFILPGGLTIDRKPGFTEGAPIALKLLVRATPDGETGMAEFYANDIMSHPFTFALGGGKATKIGVVNGLAQSRATVAVSALGQAPVQDVKAFKMTLKAE